MAVFNPLTKITAPPLSALTTFREHKSRILANGDLSPDGKATHLNNASQAVKAALKTAADLLVAEQRLAARKRESFSRPGFQAGNAEEAILHSEIRQHLKAAKPADRTALLDSADTTTLAAVLLAPPWLSGISVDFHDALRLVFAKMTHPDDWADLVTQEAALSAVEADLSAIKAELPQ